MDLSLINLIMCKHEFLKCYILIIVFNFIEIVFFK